MARRKDHTPEQLKELVVSAAEKLIKTKGVTALTARAVAGEVGYTAGTIYNIYRDMDALLTDVNFRTFGRLQEFCRSRIGKQHKDFAKVRALACAYVDFADENAFAWEAIFAKTRANDRNVHLPKLYQERLLELFGLIEMTLRECLSIPPKEARLAARVLWACLHGITTLTQDGRLHLIGIDRPHAMVDDLLEKYLAGYADD